MTCSRSPSWEVTELCLNPWFPYSQPSAVSRRHRTNQGRASWLCPGWEVGSTVKSWLHLAGSSVRQLPGRKEVGEVFLGRVGVREG